CARRDAAAETIKENYRLLMALLHPDRQESRDSAKSEDSAQRVNVAYTTIGHPDSRREYDALLRAAGPRPCQSLPARKARATGVRFKTLIAVAALMAAAVALGFFVEDEEWSDRLAAQASLSRLATNPIPGSDRPRYVGRAVASSPRASDTVHEDPKPFALLKPLMRAIAGEEPKAWVPPPRFEATATPSVVPATVAVERGPIAQSHAAPPPAEAAPTKPSSIATSEAARQTNREIENLVVALVDSYQAGDADRLVGLLEPEAGFWRTVQMRRAYEDFFRATKARRLRIEKLAWDARADAANAKGEAIVHAEYFGQASAVERRVNLELDIVLRDGQARIRRLSLFPDTR
ncbi:MAG TPA: DnaJ domain-containing protein, partial [Opitutaceae bacterium]|nr:DnaJ domain-containing protein [Opitutaceae bacterium]